MSRIVPYLAVSDAKAAIAFYTDVFGASIVEGEYYEMDDGQIGHASLSIDGQLLYLSDEFPELGAHSPTSLGGATAAVVIEVGDADEVWQRAVDAGASPDRPPANQMGFRNGWVTDPSGHRWSIQGPEKPE